MRVVSSGPSARPSASQLVGMGGSANVGQAVGVGASAASCSAAHSGVVSVAAGFGAVTPLTIRVGPVSFTALALVHAALPSSARHESARQNRSPCRFVCSSLLGVHGVEHRALDLVAQGDGMHRLRQYAVNPTAIHGADHYVRSRMRGAQDAGAIRVALVHQLQ